MRFPTLVRSLTFALVVLISAATRGHAAGAQFIDVPADASGPAIAGAVWSPCVQPAPDEVKVRGLRLGSKDCPVAGDQLPLIVISHGRTGWLAGHRDTAAALADAGFVVVAINHPGDNTFDRSRVDELAIALERPAHVKRVIDFMLGAWPDSARIDRERIGIYGFSRGGYTALAAAGARPDFHRAAARCAERTGFATCEQVNNIGTPDVTVLHDPRIKAVIAADPAFVFILGPDGLKTVAPPVQLWGSTLGGAGVTPESNALVRDRLPTTPDYRVVPNSVHWAFLTPCSPGQAKASPQFCEDPPGFDRAAFHREFNAEALAFFRKHLPAP